MDVVDADMDVVDADMDVVDADMDVVDAYMDVVDAYTTACKCDVGGSQSNRCDYAGKCTCKPMIHGTKCDQTSDGNSVRFGFDSNEFHGYSWRGYAIFSRIQDEVLLDLDVRKAGLYRVVYHYLNKNNQATTAEVRVTPDQRSHTDGHSQSSFVTFHPLVAPDFATMSSGGGVSSAFTLNPGRWTFSLKTPESVLVDYMVLLPAAYYEAPILHEKFHQPCTVPSTSDICKHYVYLDLKPFSNVPGSSGESGDGSYHEKTQLYDNQSNLDKLGLTDMAKLDERQTSITFTVPVEQPGPHVLIISYFTDDINRAQDMEADIQTPGARDSGVIRLANCPYSSPCRQFISDDSHNVKVINVDGRYFTLTLNGRSDINLAIDKVYAIPLDKWHIDLIEPKFKCIYKKEKCIQGRPAGKPPGVTIEFEIGSELPITPPPVIIEGSHPDPSIKVIKLHRREVMPRIDIKVQVTPGSYALVPLYYQPHIVGFDVDVEVYAGGQFHKGTMRADPCPSLNGCHGIVKFKDRPNVDIVDSDARVSFNSTNPVWLDYLAVIPSVSYSEKIHADNTEDDKSTEFINKCSDHGFSVDASGLQFCKDSIYSITTDYNNGALKCQCDPDGSTSFNCDPYGGKCPCKSQFIIGRDCSQCKTGYWGFPNCRECQCPTGICEPRTGRCVCPKLVTGENCDTCLPNTFGYNALVGCEECGCDARGVVSADMECDENSGQCHCKPNVAGRKCNKCKLGYYDFPRCRQCSCDLNGVLSDENVEGHDCSQCQPSTFSLLASNPKGCSQCFCFGVTSRCQASDLRWAQITELQDWTVTNTMTTAEYDEGRRMWHLQEVHLQTTDQPAYWSAPMTFLNNKVRSYGGKLRYKLLADGMEGERFKSPDFILVGKSSRVSYVHGLQEVHSSVEHAEEVHLVETKFVHERTGAPISRDQFLILLSNLQSILIMASPFKDTSYIKLSDVSMDEAREDGWGEVADSVERCECPPNHGGSSCESCAQGFFRAKNGQCLACQCNNRATTCDQTTGICINCRDNFDGPQCLKCKRGYFLDRQSNTCRICSCPLRLESNNFATHCDVSFAGVVDRCYCLPGYTGKNCDKCAPGYWGHPMTPGGQCKKCECSGNIDERDPMACDVKTGRCLKCLQNTGGERCERCADGYYGDALDGRNCKKCLCEPLGTDHCDHVTGQCVCKQNVYGPQCSQCVPGSFGFHRNRGCEMCSCGVAATSSECDLISGQCQCREGVTGRMCDRCIDGYWNYLPQGCRPCNCLSKGAVTCDKETGECQCLPGVTGPNCDKCLHKWIMIEGFGCKECDSCVQLLLDDIDVLHRNVTQMKHDLTSVSVSVQTIHHLETLDRRYHDLEPKVKMLLTDRPSSGHDVIEASREIDEVHSSAKTVLQTLNRLYNESERVEDSARDIKTEVNNYYESIRSKTKDLVDDALNKVRIKTDQLTTSGASSNVDEMVKECTAILTEMRKKGFHDEKDMALNELAKANDTLLRARELLGRSHTRLNRTTDINSSIYLILAQLQDLQRLAQSSAQRSAEVTKLLNELRNTKAHVDNKKRTSKNKPGRLDKTTQKRQRWHDVGLIIKIKNNEGQIAKCLEESRKNLNVVDDDLNEAKKAFNSAISDLERLKTLVADAQRFVHKLVAENENLKTLLRQHTRMMVFDFRTDSIRTRSISNTESSVKLAIEASGVYETIVKTIEEAWKDSQEAERLVNVARNMSVILSIDTSEKSAQLGNISKQINLIKMSIDRAILPMFLADLVDKLAIIQGMLKSMKESEKDKSYTDVVKGLEDIKMEDYETIFEDSRSEVEENRQILSSYSTKLQELDKNLTASVERIRSLPQQLSEMNSDVRVAYQDMQVEVSKIEETIFVMEDLTRQSDQLIKLEDELKYNMDLLRDYIRQARDAANLVTLGVNFTHESVLQVRNSIDMPSSGMVSKISLHFQTKQADGLLFYIGKDSGLADDYMIGEIVGGHPQFRINLGSVETVVKGTKPVNNNQITTYEIRREGKDLKLFIDSNPIDGEVSGDSFTFQYDNSTKFYVGGVPDHILKQNSNLSSILPRNKFVGVIENLVYDERMVGLWNFVDASGLRGAHFKKIKIFSEDNIFTYGGTGYAHMKIENQLIEENLDVSFDFKTYSKDALLFHQGTDTQFITLDLVDGKLRGVMDMGSGGLPRISESTYNDGLWHSVSFSRRNRVAVLRIDTYTVPRMAVNGWKMIYEGESDFFIGGLKNPDNYTKPTKSRFKGCIRNFQAKSAPYPIQSAIEFVDVQYGCRQSIRVVSFPPSPIATGYIKLFKDSFSLSNDFAMSFKFRSQQSDALIFYIFGDSQNIGLSLSLVDGYLKLVFKDDDENASEELTSPFKFNDGAWHYVNVKRTKNLLSLETEDKWTGTRAFTSRARIPGQQHVYLGGVPDSVSVTLKNVGSNKPFVGCIGDISINSKLQNFDEVQNADLINVDIGTCQYMDYLPPQGPSSFYSTSTVDPGVINPELKGCTRPAYPLSTWKERGCEGSSASGYYYEYSDGPTSISKFVLTLNLKTSSPDGVIFYAYNQQHSDFIALFMKGGAMHGFVNCGGGITKTALQGVNFADDAWHNVYFRYEDGLVTLNVGRHSNNTALMGSQTSVEVTAPIFMAGLPQQVFQSSIVNFADKKPDTWMFNGELKDITLQGKPIESKLIARSSSPGAKCPVEQGIFFFPVSTPFKTYGSVYPDYSAPTHMNISFMIKPRLLDGILFSVHNPANDEFIILQLVKGEFHLTVNNGQGHVMKSDFKPSNKMFWCERKWYSVSANKVKNVVYVIVDGLRGTSGFGIEGYSSTDTSNELFIGGAKEMHSGMLVSNSFVGCMKDLYVEGKPVPLRDLQFKGDILQDGCPVD
ncbi:hypothetical protein HELRODRAFT_192596 [Helobdella robusta]|uniref:Uncharacterized protein n=1 Tax=Helobdella robusta TaxID=6412 RepID=T1FU41_HELRO|nr:hypothetical protein HELRODRAFT_192596 [Helobdella robusta]ESO00345.1 hypothetical protein HELRODRAFT_192596 [Helobdella robusta]